MIGKAYRVVRQVYDQQRLFSDYPEYKGYSIYQMEGPASPYSFQRATLYLITRENWGGGQTVFIDEDSEISPVRNGATPYISGSKVSVYRPGNSLSSEFRIVSQVKDMKDIEKFGSGIDMPRSHYRLYEAIREGSNGYTGVTVRIFADATDVDYGRGMGIPINETIALPRRSAGEPQHYLHDTSCQNYKDRVWRAIRRASGATNP
ncbi:MAG: hypothetical protein HYS17_08720 [Micavibrio aeruginosavorus]|uniref:Uncharacterized protein n=1 Tax=Micavibrio aeruginosavorus TaxID=349221 RepID=A0A7T5R155_9BACT|nr:MAG: hypothetical protein HYS17_08720 [Micavibrio aeruginosavorus]